MIRAIALSVCLFGSPAKAHDIHVHATAPTCEHTYSEALQGFAAVHREMQGSQLTEYAGGDAQKIMDVINATPPETHFHTEHLLAIVNLGGVAVVGFEVGACFQGPMSVPADKWQAVVSQALGEPS